MERVSQHCLLYGKKGESVNIVVYMVKTRVVGYYGHEERRYIRIISNTVCVQV